MNFRSDAGIFSILIVVSDIFVHLQAAGDEEAEKYERTFILQLLGTSSVTNSCEVWFSFSLALDIFFLI